MKIRFEKRSGISGSLISKLILFSAFTSACSSSVPDHPQRAVIPKTSSKSSAVSQPVTPLDPDPTSTILEPTASTQGDDAPQTSDSDPNRRRRRRRSPRSIPLGQTQNRRNPRLAVIRQVEGPVTTPFRRISSDTLLASHGTNQESQGTTTDASQPNITSPTRGETPGLPDTPLSGFSSQGNSNSSTPSVRTIPISLNRAWLSRSSRVDQRTCRPASTLYRGIHHDFAPLLRVVRNMLGDITSEMPSWRLTKYFSRTYGGEELSRLTIPQWELGREVLLAQLTRDSRNDTSLCDFTRRSIWPRDASAFTRASYSLVRDWKSRLNHWLNPMGWIDFGSYFVGQPEAYWDTFGISATTRFSKAVEHSRIDTENYLGSVIEIQENIPRAAPDSDGQVRSEEDYQFPIVIPAEDITAAWFELPENESSGRHSHSIRKVVSDDRRELTEIQIFQAAGIPESPSHEGQLEAKIVPCARNSRCDSDSFSDDAELESIASFIAHRQFLGTYFKLISVPSTPL